MDERLIWDNAEADTHRCEAKVGNVLDIGAIEFHGGDHTITDTGCGENNPLVLLVNSDSVWVVQALEHVLVELAIV